MDEHRGPVFFKPDELDLLLEALDKASKASTPDGEFVFCPVCNKMSWIGHDIDCVLARALSLVERKRTAS